MAKHHDIWALGVILFQMATSHLPFVAITTDGLLNSIRNSEPNFDKIKDTHLKNLIKSMLVKEPSKRATIE